MKSSKLFWCAMAILFLVITPRAVLAAVMPVTSFAICADKLGEICITNAYDNFITGHHNPVKMEQSRVECETQYSSRVLAWREYHKNYEVARQPGWGPERASADNRAACMRTLRLMSQQNGLTVNQIRQEQLEQRRARQRAQRIRNEQELRGSGRVDLAQRMEQERLAEEARLRSLYRLDHLSSEDTQKLRHATQSSEADAAAATLARMNSADLRVYDKKPVFVLAEPELPEKTVQDGLPKELELRAVDNNRALIFVRKGAYFAQITGSWLTKDYDTNAKAVYAANEFKDTYGICVHADGTKILDPERMKIASWEQDRLDGAPNVQFMKDCKGEFTIALQGFQLLVLPHKKLAAPKVPAAVSDNSDNASGNMKEIKEVSTPQPSPATATSVASNSEKIVDSETASRDVGEKKNAGNRDTLLPPRWRMSPRLYYTELTPELCARDPGFCIEAHKARKALAEAKAKASGGQDTNPTDPP